ncbi:MAG: ATP-dependent Clp protease proteolytic subunit [Clostridia bacterium]|nr:ATP-dependent Clp protease proteolytic subunit [Clostridia bacterium]
MNNLENNNKKTENTENIFSSIEENGSVCGRFNGVNIQCVSIIGQIEGHYLLPENQKTTKYEHLLPMLFEIERNPEVDGMLLILNTVGGDVEAGLAIAEMIASMQKPTVSLVIGGGHSIGVPLAVSAKYSFIVPSATMTVHPVRITGTVLGAPQSYLYFKKMQDRITEFVIKHSKCKKDLFDSLLYRTKDIATDLGTVLEGKDAVKTGIVDSVGGLKEACEKLEDLIKYKNI